MPDKVTANKEGILELKKGGLEAMLFVNKCLLEAQLFM